MLYEHIWNKEMTYLKFSLKKFPQASWSYDSQSNAWDNMTQITNELV